MAERLIEDVSRRNFVKGAFASGVALAAGGALVACAPSGGGKQTSTEQVVPAGIPEKWDYETDVLCLGGGGTGITAALWAKYSGAEALVLEKGETSLTCSAALSDGQWCAGGTSVQKTKGIDDSPEKFFKWVESVQSKQQVCESDLETAKTICDTATPVLEWLLKLGCEVKGELQSFLDMDEKRWHTLKMQDVMGILLDECKTQGIEIMNNVEGTRLIVNGEGRVIGAQAKDGNSVIYVKARRGVVLGTGGYSASPEMLAVYNGKKYMNAKPVGCKKNTGDGYRMAMEIGAALRDVYVPPSLALATADTLVGIVQLPRAGGILVNDKAQRYTAENIGASPEASATSLQTGKTFIIHDSPQMSMEHAAITLDRHTKLGGKIYNANTVEDLAKQIGLDPAALAETVSKYNSYCEAGSDPDFGRNTIDELQGSAPAPALATPPFYAIEVCAAIYPTQMRLNSDGKARVRDQFGEAIPGLYAGGLMGNIGIRNPASGQVVTALTGAFALGYVAGQEASALEPWK